MALRTTTRTIRSGRPRRRRIRRSHRHWSRQRLPIVATSVGLLGLLGLLVLAYFMTGKDKEDG